MKRDSKLSDVLHVLLHIGAKDGPTTSEEMAKVMRYHPVVVRRIFARLREAGLVQSDKGHGGGWSIARPLAEISLRDLYEALGQPPLIAMDNRSSSPTCLVEQTVNCAMDQSFEKAEALLLSRFSEISLASLQTAFEKRLSEPNNARERD